MVEKDKDVQAALEQVDKLTTARNKTRETATTERL
jgi:hypothetical protein